MERNWRSPDSRMFEDAETIFSVEDMARELRRKARQKLGFGPDSKVPRRIEDLAARIMRAGGWVFNLDTKRWECANGADLAASLSGYDSAEVRIFIDWEEIKRCLSLLEKEIERR